MLKRIWSQFLQQGTHGLFNNNTVFVDINPSISTSFAIKYNAPNRKLVTTGIAFTSGNVTTGSDNLYLANHGLVTGQKVIHSSSSPSGGSLQATKSIMLMSLIEITLNLPKASLMQTEQFPLLFLSQVLLAELSSLSTLH